jgi:hypothetical protein
MLNLSNILIIFLFIFLVLNFAVNYRTTLRTSITYTASTGLFVPTMYLCKDQINSWLADKTFMPLESYELSRQDQFYFIRGIFLISVMVSLLLIIYFISGFFVKKRSPFVKHQEHHVVNVFLKMYNFLIIGIWLVPLLVELNYLMKLDLGYLDGIFNIVLKIGGGK